MAEASTGINYDQLVAGFEGDALLDLLTAAETRAASLGLRPEASAVALNGAGVSLSLEWLGDQHATALAALGELGFSKKVLETEVPSLEQVTDIITVRDAAWLNRQRADQGMHRRLIIVPRVQDIGLKGTARRPGLITRFDKKQDIETAVWTDLWEQFDDKAPVHDNGETAKWSVGILLGDTKDPRDTSKPANAYDEAGLVFTSMTVQQQRDALEAEAKTHAAAGRELRPATVGALVVANAQRRLEGKPLLDQQTFTRLTHYPDTYVPARGASYVPSVNSFERQLGLDGSGVGNGWSNNGVRRVLRVAVKS